MEVAVVQGEEEVGDEDEEEVENEEGVEDEGEVDEEMVEGVGTETDKEEDVLVGGRLTVIEQLVAPATATAAGAGDPPKVDER
eukprot:CAMPEP_0177678696 /NCGR_PEP_ID=MMETSP0447-20121125/29150_1 /TAXON_ID=0 /ORGANISM="Stygamoeba regulata, Strain BSH-02190019" /LENGTH=82 /DNA_ID=CAMNT_0019187723 /DNA_START=109 /DNA_END=353 /DNA_ORIENTATION=+